METLESFTACASLVLQQQQLECGEPHRPSRIVKDDQYQMFVKLSI